MEAHEEEGGFEEEEERGGEKDYHLFICQLGGWLYKLMK